MERFGTRGAAYPGLILIWTTVAVLALRNAPATVYVLCLGSLLSLAIVTARSRCAGPLEARVLNGSRDFLACALLAGGVFSALQLYLAVTTSPGALDSAATLSRKLQAVSRFTTGMLDGKEFGLLVLAGMLLSLLLGATLAVRRRTAEGWSLASRVGRAVYLMLSLLTAFTFAGSEANAQNAARSAQLQRAAEGLQKGYAALEAQARTLLVQRLVRELGQDDDLRPLLTVYPMLWNTAATLERAATHLPPPPGTAPSGGGPSGGGGAPTAPGSGGRRAGATPGAIPGGGLSGMVSQAVPSLRSIDAWETTVQGLEELSHQIPPPEPGQLIPAEVSTVTLGRAQETAQAEQTRLLPSEFEVFVAEAVSLSVGEAGQQAVQAVLQRAGADPLTEAVGLLTGAFVSDPVSALLEGAVRELATSWLQQAGQPVAQHARQFLNRIGRSTLTRGLSARAHSWGAFERAVARENREGLRLLGRLPARADLLALEGQGPHGELRRRARAIRPGPSFQHGAALRDLLQAWDERRSGIARRMAARRGGTAGATWDHYFLQHVSSDPVWAAAWDEALRQFLPQDELQAGRDLRLERLAGQVAERLEASARKDIGPQSSGANGSPQVGLSAADLLAELPPGAGRDALLSVLPGDALAVWQVQVQGTTGDSAWHRDLSRQAAAALGSLQQAALPGLSCPPISVRRHVGDWVTRRNGVEISRRPVYGQTTVRACEVPKSSPSISRAGGI